MTNYSTHYPTKCAECPFARSLGGERYACSHNGLKDHEVVRGHWAADPKECYSEIDKAIKKEGNYASHYLNDQSDRLNKVMRSEVSPHAIAWFLDCQETRVIFLLQSEAKMLFQFCKENQIEIIEGFAPLSPPCLVVQRTAPHAFKKTVCQVHYYPRHYHPYYRDKFIAKGAIEVVSGSLKEALEPFIQDFDKPFLDIGREALAYA